MGRLKKAEVKGYWNNILCISTLFQRGSYKTANSVTMTYCKSIDKHKVNKTRLIAIIFLNHEDQEYFLKLKKSLPKGIYMDEEHPSEVWKVRAKLYPIFKYAKHLESYKGKCKILYDSILIDSIKYGITDLLKLTDEINPLKTSQKSDNKTLVFFGPHRSFSNFHQCKFSVSGKEYTSNEQYIQY